ncbi:MAG: glycosyltransferase family 4 protein [Bacteroidetes bacterium]|nr:glycosyltransferase family 4 protein [Bacteroidota bacterium]
MRVFYDLYEVAFDRGKSIGIYKYGLALLDALALNNPGVNFTVACSAEYGSDVPDHRNIRVRLVSGNYPSMAQRFYWRYYNAIKTAKKENADIYFSPKGFSPGFGKRKTRPLIVVTVHDMIPFYYREKRPHYFGFFHNLVITKMMLRSIHIANSIITVSNFSKEKITAYSGNHKEINVIYNGVTVAGNQTVNDKRGQYIFAITSNFPHKNKVNLIKGYLAYARTASDPLPLKVCGIDSTDIDVPMDNADISFIKYAKADELKDLFIHASAFLFVSEIEGLGFPPLEALLYNITSVVSDIPVLREVLSESAVFVDPYDTGKIGAGLKTLLEDTALYNTILDNKKPLADKYTWEKCSERTMEVFKMVAWGV